jgi:hypothetical protein
MLQAFGKQRTFTGWKNNFRQFYFALGWLTLAVGVESGVAAQTNWSPAPGALMTRWAAEVSPTNDLPEYPRPQLVRTDWLNLNGLWDYSITPSTSTEATNFAGQILVPFPIESSLSDVMHPLDENSTLWYRRHFAVPKTWASQRVRVHFGAVDWHARVRINGEPIGQHHGGYDDFSFDITDNLKWNGDEEITVAVQDPTDGDQPHGKQSRKSENIFYTPTSGIWQTVWLEPVPKICIDDLRLTPDVDKNILRVRAAVGSQLESLKVEIVALSSNQEIARAAGPVNREFSLPLAAAHLWTPDDPFLYDLKITLKDGNRTVDSVSSYFGMRKIALKKDEEGKIRIALNDQFTFQMGALDQGFWPDGIYTAPTDEALRFDIESLKRAGFNLARKHVKVEPDRWYYWCDKLGLLVWQDMPSGKNTTIESRLQFETELQRMVEGRGNHPSIIVWVLFNEGWGQYDTERLVPWLKSIDSSRLIDDASGWTDKRVGDIIDTHSYPGPESPQPEADRAAVLGEFGGLGLGMAGHTWSGQSWGYQPMPDVETLNSHYRQLLDRVHILNYSFGLSAAIYTQTADVETECNGLMTYDRAISKLDPATTLAANVGENPQKHYQVIVPNALYRRVPWKYTTEKPGDQWFKREFADANWKEGIGGFGTQGTPNTMLNTTWGTSDIWLRREFTLNHDDLSHAVLQVHHDEDAEIYLNGILAAKLPGYDTLYLEQKINPEALATLQPGVNIIAVHCHQTSGGQFIDAGIVIPLSTKPAEAKK